MEKILVMLGILLLLFFSNEMFYTAHAATTNYRTQATDQLLPKAIERENKGPYPISFTEIRIGPVKYLFIRFDNGMICVQNTNPELGGLSCVIE